LKVGVIMQWYHILIIILLSLTFLFFLTTFICYFLTFFIGKKKIYAKDEYDIPFGKEYEQYKDLMIQGQKEMRELSYKQVQITSFDNLKLYARYYECTEDHVLEIMFHGYRGSAERDLSGGIKRAFALNHNVLLVDQRASSLSDGHTTTFGVNERRDCMSWVKYVVENFPPDTKIILTGVSMGAATVILASELDLAENVIGVLADCSYSSQKEVIQKVIKEMKLPPAIFYPLIKMGAKIFGRFNIEERTPLEAIINAKVPVLLFHGDIDPLVPHEMSIKLHTANKEMTKLVLIPNAGHCLCYLIEPELYLKEMKDFFKC
jgi:pimeloyl-ACP methyl ester carboxylesterase